MGDAGDEVGVEKHINITEDFVAYDKECEFSEFDGKPLEDFDCGSSIRF